MYTPDIFFAWKQQKQQIERGTSSSKAPKLRFHASFPGCSFTSETGNLGMCLIYERASLPVVMGPRSVFSV